MRLSAVWYDVCLLSSRHRDMQEKTTALETNTALKIGLKFHVDKNKIMKIHSSVTTPITIKGKAIEEVKRFIYLSSKITSDDDCSTDVKSRLAKAQDAFVKLKPVMKSSKYKIKTKLRIFQSNVLCVLL